MIQKEQFHSTGKSISGGMAVIIALLLSSPGARGADGAGAHGGNPTQIDQVKLQRLLEGDALKAAMRNYLDTIDPSKITQDPKWAKAKAALGSRGSWQSLKDDIAASSYEAGGTECRESNPGSNAKAWAKIGDRGGKICFDLDPETGLYADYKGLSEEEAMIRLAALAFHEHIHHGQDPQYATEKEKEYEDEANEVGSYVELSAKVAQLPVLEWRSSQENPKDAYSPDSCSGPGMTPERALDFLGAYRDVYLADPITIGNQQQLFLERKRNVIGGVPGQWTSQTFVGHAFPHLSNVNGKLKLYLRWDMTQFDCKPSTNGDYFCGDYTATLKNSCIRFHRDYSIQGVEYEEATVFNFDFEHGVSGEVQYFSPNTLCHPTYGMNCPGK